jgi:Rha family phage regulatory protein
MTKRSAKVHAQVIRNATEGVGAPGAEVRPRLRAMRSTNQVVTCSLDIMAFFGRDRHDPILAAVYKATRCHSPEFAAANFHRSEYKTGRGQWKPCYWVTRAGLDAICRHLEKTRETLPVYLEAFDKASERLKAAAEGRYVYLSDKPAELRVVAQEPEPEPPPDLGPDTIPEDTGLDPEPDLPPLNEPVVHADGMRVYATTLDIAAFFRKQHKNVLANIREIEAIQPEFAGLNFQPCSYQGDNGKELPAYEVTKAGFALVVGGFTGAKALEFRVRYIQRYEEMEAALKDDGVKRYGSLDDLMADPAGLMTLTLSYAGQIKEQKAEILTLETQVSVLEPKAAALDRLADKAGTMSLRNTAKALGFGPDWFRRRLEELDYLYREDGRLAAYQKHIDAGLFVHRPVELSHRDGTEYVVSQPLVTAKGLARLAVAFGVGVRAVLGQGVLGLRRDPPEGEAWH